MNKIKFVGLFALHILSFGYSYAVYTEGKSDPSDC